MRQRLLFNGWALVSIIQQTSGSHLPCSPPMQSDTLELGSLQDKCGRNMLLETIA